MKANIVLLPGDGIGPEIIHQARQVLEACASRFGHELSFETHLIGGAAIDETGIALPGKTLDACEKADAVLLGAVGGPRWDLPTSPVRPEQGLLGLRRALGLFGNLRPVKPVEALSGSSPLRPERLVGVDLLFVRELTGGLYFGEPRRRRRVKGGVQAIDTLTYTDSEIRRVVRLAFDLARDRHKRVTSVDKANVLESSRLWRQVVLEVAEDYPDVELEHQLVDSAAMRLVTNPSSFDVIVTENMFGDILSDEASVLAGSLGLLPSASIGAGTHALYEPVHGSAPDIAGQNVANPLAAILSGALLMRHSLGLDAAAAAIETAVDRVLAEGGRTADLETTNPMSTADMGAAVIAQIEVRDVQCAEAYRYSRASA